MKIIFLSIILLNQIFSQNFQDKIKETDRLEKRYITDDNGNILIRANIWGEVSNPGSHIINEGVDIFSFISIVGGPKDGSNLSKIKLYRENFVTKNYSLQIIDLSGFLENGDGENIIEIKPNDTIIIPQKRMHYFLKQINAISTLLSITTLIFQVLNTVN